MEPLSIDPAFDPRWLALLDASPEAGLFQSPPWLRALADAYGFAIRAHLVTDAAGRPRAGLAFSELSDLFGPRTVSLPFSDACDPLVREAGDWEQLFAAVAARAVPATFRCLHGTIVSADPRLQVTKRARWHSVPVLATAERQRAALADPARRNLAKAERGGVLIRPLDRVGDFHRLHVALRKRKYRLLAQPIEFFESIERRFREVDGWHPLGAYVEDRLVASTVYLRWRDVLYYKFNASALEQLALRPNHLLVWAGLELARELGCRRLDLGPSDDDQPGLIRFKRHFGAEERELRFLRYVPPGWGDEQSHEARTLLAELTGQLTAPELPDEVTARAGAALYRFFA